MCFVQTLGRGRFIGAKTSIARAGLRRSTRKGRPAEPVKNLYQRVRCPYRVRRCWTRSNGYNRAFGDAFRRCWHWPRTPCSPRWVGVNGGPLGPIRGTERMLGRCVRRRSVRTGSQHAEINAMKPTWARPVPLAVPAVPVRVMPATHTVSAIA
jgi:hypothetical protein